jgi:hypothetical protein
LAAAALELSRIEGWKALGFTYASDFARERLDRSSSWLRQLARLGRTCRELPALTDAITGADGGKPLARAAAYEVCRVARPDTVADWIQRARGCTIRQLKEAIRRTQDTGPSSAETTPLNRRQDSLRLQLPVFLRGAILDVERVFLATNPSSRRSDLIEALTAEHASGDAGGMIDVGNACSNHMEPGGPKAEYRSTRSRRPTTLRGLRVLPGTSGARHVSDFQGAATVELDDNTTNRDLLQARWTLHRVRLFIESLEDRMSASTDSGTDDSGTADSGLGRSTLDRTRSPEHIEQCMREILALEREVTLRIDDLLLWLDHRRAWSLLGFADAAEFGLRVLGESASTTRNRLRLARTLQCSAALRRRAEAGRLSHQRLVRLAQLLRKNNLDERTRLDKTDEAVLRQWVDHSLPIQVKRLDEDLDAVERRRWSATAVGSGEDTGQPGAPPTHGGKLPLPPSDTEWQASLRLVPGEARRRLLMGALQALATGEPANVCHRFTAPATTIRDLRQSLNLARVRLAEQGHRLVQQRSPGPSAPSPADESRLFPSIRLAAQHVERGTPIPDWICLLSLLEEFVEEWDNPRNMPRRPTDAIASRDGWRCTAPGCTSRHIEVHHIVYRSHGGSDDPSNLTSLCPFHHRMGEHGGLLKVTGTAPLNLRWQIGDRIFVNERLVSEQELDSPRQSAGTRS